MTGIIITPDFVLADGLMTIGDTIQTHCGQKIGIGHSDNPSLEGAPYIWGITGGVVDGTTAHDIVLSSRIEIMQMSGMFPKGEYSLFLVRPGMRPSQSHDFGGSLQTLGYRIDDGVPACFNRHTGPIEFQGSAGNFLEAAYFGANGDIGHAVEVAIDRRRDFGGELTLIPLPTHGAPLPGGFSEIYKFDSGSAADRCDMRALIYKLEDRK